MGQNGRDQNCEVRLRNIADVLDDMNCEMANPPYAGQDGKEGLYALIRVVTPSTN